jgi:glycine dehydrogenase subunit 1
VTKLDGFTLAYNQPFFKDVLIKTTKDPKSIHKALYDKGYLGPLHLGDCDKEKQGYLLFSATEKRTKEEIDTLVSVLEVL